MGRKLSDTKLTGLGNDAKRSLNPNEQFALLLLTPAANYDACLDVAAKRTKAEASKYPELADDFANQVKVVKQDLRKLKAGYAETTSLRPALPEGRLPVLVIHLPSIGFQVKVVGGSCSLPWLRVDVELLISRSTIVQDWRPFVDYFVTQHPALANSEPYARKWGFNAASLKHISMTATLFNYDARSKNGISELTFGGLLVTAGEAADADRAHALEGSPESWFYEREGHVEYRGPALSTDFQRPINPFGPNEDSKRKGKAIQSTSQTASERGAASSQQPPFKPAGGLKLVWSVPQQ